MSRLADFVELHSTVAPKDATVRCATVRRTTVRRSTGILVEVGCAHFC